MTTGSSARPRFRIGADENGLGPRLGPMTTTAVLAEVDERGHARVEKKARGKMRARIGDSKALVAHGDVAIGEAWARVMAERALGRPATSVDEVVVTLSRDPVEWLVAPCPGHVKEQCWNASGAFVASEAELKAVRKDVDRLAASGVALRGARSVIVCTQRLNRELDQGRTRFAVDLHAMERLVLGFRDEVGADVLAVCGKVGGLRQYEPAFGPLSGRLCSVLSERKEHSAYWFPGVGELRFVMDADDSDMLVSIASLIGKYLREILMAKIVEHYRAHKPELKDASGYHDNITDGFVEATRLLRKKLKVHDDCFERRSLKDLA